MKKTSPKTTVAALCDRRYKGGFTLAEMVATLAVLGILSSLAIASYSGVNESAREAVARDSISLLNRAVLHFEQANWKLAKTADNNDTADELEVLRSLQWRDPNPKKATPGSPYLSTGFDDNVSAAEDDYRIQWNGATFELLLPGDPGKGLRTGSSSPESANGFNFSEDYHPLGATQ